MSHRTTYDYRGLPSLRPKKTEPKNSIPARLLMGKGVKPLLPGMIKKKSKYLNKAVKIDGIRFSSGKEARRYQELQMKEKAGLISNLEVHPRFKIEANGEHICFYYADFKYYDNGLLVVEDTKGIDPRKKWDTRTETYKLKKILMRVINKIEVREI